ncbi:M60 family metallopeptidase [Bacteroides acidifaciens]|uniref:Carbohydrate-binding protein n=1 Tax=Bacteroides acidifaciens TaxID=85831 RepID=A0A7K3MHN5_9BACE|nr:M60 family metallopeptidase [Bacteroides acidifaciens]MBF0728088.1 carbohydrate-binding protein [Bacteroides acidifaciens]MBF0834283.1 carbohydrate-binding protein [Bacteroides acidifaciens]NDO54072.1 carbohydrate-binding protein [Bacteroides acidifaciens]TFU53319.1 carbohydrate-binding protein [Bacteroides acidifaciens]
MKILHSLLYLFLISLHAFSWTACSDDGPEGTNNYTFSINESDLHQDCTQAQASLSIPVNTNLNEQEWGVTSDQSWCIAAKDLSTSTPSIKLLIKASEEPEVRNATVTVKSSVQNYIINVRQLGYGPAILVKSSVTNIEDNGGPVTITVTSNIEYTIEKSKDSEWLQETDNAPNTRALVDKIYSYNAEANPLYEPRTVTFTYTYIEDDKIKETYVITQKAKETNISDVELENDIKLQPTRATASEFQQGYGIEKTYDGKIDDEHYHSVWGQSANFPVTLEYFFDGTQDLDYIIYYTRSGNGNFGELDLYTATTDEPEYKLYNSYDFKMQNAASRISFTESLSKITKIKFSVKSGLGNFVSCSEMEFYQNNTDNKLEKQLLEVFTDITCCELKPEATDEQINKLPGYFASLAVQIRNNTYDEWEKEFRIRNYEAYSDVNIWANKLMTKHYSCLDNLTGISVEQNDEIIVLVGDTHGQDVSLQCVGEESTGFLEEKPYVQTAASGDIYYLKQGVNKITIRNRGQLFVMYNCDLTSKPAPIKIHIPLGSGKVSGFFDLKTHKTDAKYAELLSKATDKYFGVKGNNIIFYFHRTKMLEHVRNNILSAIELWDNIIGWEQELMGIDDVRPSQFNNHLFAISPEGSYMWASDYRIAFVYTYLGNILLYDNVMAAEDNAWGPAHEIGHIHQKAIDWAGCTESSNNLFSNFIIYKLGKYKSRGNGLVEVANARYRDKQLWYNMGDATHQGEDTEVHMRMNWQLWNYYHRCGYKTDFWQTLFKLMREEVGASYENDPGRKQLAFAKMASKAANENLTDFFEMWGFFGTVSTNISQYGDFQYTVTQPMIDEAKRFMAQYPQPKHAFQYIEDRKKSEFPTNDYRYNEVGDVGYYTQFQNNVKITKAISATISGNAVSIQNGEEAVAFEVRERSENGKILYFSNSFTFDVPASISMTNAKVFAVQADGKRVPLN